MFLLNSYSMSGNTFTTTKFHKLFLLCVLTQMGCEFLSIVINLNLPKILRFPVCFSLVKTASLSLSSILSLAFCKFLITVSSISSVLLCIYMVILNLQEDCVQMSSAS